MATYGAKFNNGGGVKFGFDAQTVMLDGEAGVYTIWDVSAPYIYISELYFENFIEQLYTSVGMAYTIENGVPTAKCKPDNLPALYFDVNGHWLFIPAWTYKTKTI
jgi:hypothetical protein